jgi:VanZ family protein
MSNVLRFVPALLWAAAIFGLSSQSALPGPPLPVAGADKLAHAGEYAVLVLLLLAADRGRRPWFWAAVAILYGVSDELHQLLVPRRHADLLDLLADSAGTILATALWLRLRRSTRLAAGARAANRLADRARDAMS